MPGRGRRTAPHDVQECMVFRPSMEEFDDFANYMEFIESKGAHIAGIAKIIPPKEWRPRKKGYDISGLQDIMIHRPIKQIYSQIGDRKVYQTKSCSKEPMNVGEYFALSNSNTYKTPAHHSYDDLERKYWKSLSFVSPIYGADVGASITDEDIIHWNIGKLKSTLSLLSEQKESYDGVTTPYLYFGMWKTTFSWHVEDMDLYAINFLHYGMPKTWYCVPPKYGYLLERAARKLFPNVSNWCSNFMRHKTCLITPSILDELGVPYQKVVQEERNMIIVFPYAYHSGFNHGFNIAESTNFALPRWVEYGKRHRPCDCSGNLVKFNMDIFVQRFQPERYEKWLKGLDIAPHPEDPPELAEEIRLQAKDPEAYALLMKERFARSQEEKSEKLIFQTSTGRSFSVFKHSLEFVRDFKRHKLSEGEKEEFKLWKEDQKKYSNIVFKEAGGPIVSSKRRLVHIYQHVTLNHLQIKVLPRTLTVIGKGLSRLKEVMSNERFQNVKELIDKGLLIKIGERQMKRRVRENLQGKDLSVKETTNEYDGVPSLLSSNSSSSNQSHHHRTHHTYKYNNINNKIGFYKHVSRPALTAVLNTDSLDFYEVPNDALIDYLKTSAPLEKQIQLGYFVKEREESTTTSSRCSSRRRKLKPLSKQSEVEIWNSSQRILLACSSSFFSSYKNHSMALSQYNNNNINESDSFSFYNVYKETGTNKIFVVGPESHEQPKNVSPLEDFDETLFESLEDPNRFEIISTNVKLKTHLFYSLNVMTIHFYEHRDSGTILKVNKDYTKIINKGRRRKELSELIGNGSSLEIVLKDESAFQYRESKLHVEFYVRPGIGSDVKLFKRDKKTKLSFFRRKKKRERGEGRGDEKIFSGIKTKTQRLYISKFEVQGDSISWVDVISFRGKTLYRFDYKGNEVLDTCNECLFLGNTLKDLWDKGVLKISSEPLSNIEYYYNILNIQIKASFRYQYDIDNERTEKMIVDAHNSGRVLKSGPVGKRLLENKTVETLLTEGLLTNRISIAKYLGLVGLKKAVMKLENLKDVKGESGIDIRFTSEGSLILKYPRGGDVLILKNFKGEGKEEEETLKILQEYKFVVERQPRKSLKRTKEDGNQVGELFGDEEDKDKKEKDSFSIIESQLCEQRKNDLNEDKEKKIEISFFSSSSVKQDECIRKEEGDEEQEEEEEDFDDIEDSENDYDDEISVVDDNSEEGSSFSFSSSSSYSEEEDDSDYMESHKFESKGKRVTKGGDSNARVNVKRPRKSVEQHLREYSEIASTFIQVLNDVKKKEETHFSISYLCSIIQGNIKTVKINEVIELCIYLGIMKQIDESTFEWIGIETTEFENILNDILNAQSEESYSTSSTTVSPYQQKLYQILFTVMNQQRHFIHVSELNPHDESLLHIMLHVLEGLHLLERDVFHRYKYTGSLTVIQSRASKAFEEHQMEFNLKELSVEVDKKNSLETMATQELKRKLSNLSPFKETPPLSSPSSSSSTAQGLKRKKGRPRKNKLGK